MIGGYIKMSKLTIDQKSVCSLLSDKKNYFLIPDYQRPYAWEEKECQVLWDDIFSFAFPGDSYSNFKSGEEYFLGPIVTFKNEQGNLEIIDGQQRLTTLMLLLRAFYAKYGNMKDEDSVTTSNIISTCIWKTNEFNKPDKTALKIDSEVATDDKKDEFLSILKKGEAPDTMKSNYAHNYRFFQKKIEKFLQEYPGYFSYLPIRILNNCILLPIEAESQDTALQIFSTLNDRGKPLSDADIFKAQFYKYYTQIGEKESFITRWKELEVLCEKIFHPTSGTPMDEIFTRYMYFERSRQGNKSSTTEALRKFYEKDSYALLKKEETFDNLIDLAYFWRDVENQSKEKFSEKVLKKLFVLNYAPNGMWTYIVSVYYMANRSADGMLDEESFCNFLNKITAFIWAYAITNPGVNSLRTPIFAEMVNIVKGDEVTFKDNLFPTDKTKSMFENYVFSNNRAITKSMLTWWAYTNDEQELLSLESSYEIEHIYAKNRQDIEHSLKNTKNIEALGNKALLEKRINIRASDYKFIDKKKYYFGYNVKNGYKEGTKIKELVDMANSKSDFIEFDIEKRTHDIIDGFVSYLNDCELLEKGLVAAH